MKAGRAWDRTVRAVAGAGWVGWTALAAAAPPTDNPVAAHYGGPEGYPAWTDGIHWSRVVDMSAYAKGKTNFEKFENARDELAAQGGGVLYYPAGTYDFRDGPFDGPAGRGLMLRSGVIIRGEAPAGKPNAARDGALDLKTRFVFGFTRRTNAIDEGSRVSITIEKAVTEAIAVRPSKDAEMTVEQSPRDLLLNFQVQGDTLRPEGLRSFLRLYGRDDHGVQARVKQDGAAIRLEVDLEIKAVVDPRPKNKEEIVRKGTLTAVLQRQGDELTGTYTGTYDGREVKGSAKGMFGVVRAETPKDWNIIGLKPEPERTVRDVRNVGICWVHMDGATVYFGPELAWGETWGTANDYKGPNVKAAWASRRPDGTHPYDPYVGAMKAKEGDPNSGRAVGAGRGRLVFGCVLERAAFLNDFETCGRPGSASTNALGGFGAHGYHMAKFAGRIAAYGSRVFVANNVLPRCAAGGFKYPQITCETASRRGNDFWIGEPKPAVVMWDYGRTMGIDVNKDAWGLVGQTAKTAGLGYLAEGVAVTDNRVWNHGHKGFNVSGCWGVVRGNHNDRAFLKGGDDIYGIGGGWRLTLDGFIQTASGGGGMISDNLSRAFDLAGNNLWIDGNCYHSTGSSPGIDGEGILCQGSGGTYLRSWAITRNRHEKGQGHGGYMAAFNVNIWGLLIAWNKTDDFVGMVWRNNEIADLAFVANQAREVKHYDKALIEAKGVPAAPREVRAEPYEGDAVRVSWSDASDNEIGFRVDRRIGDGPWAAIAYRPPRIEGSEHNPQTWVDFLAPTGKPLFYRVAAINADDKDDGASGPTTAVTLAAVSK